MLKQAICFPWSRGQRKQGTQVGALWIAQQIEQKFPQIKLEIIDSQQSADIQKNMELLCQRIQEINDNIFIAGGDHSEAIGTVLGTLNMPKNKNKKFGVVWIDAHADINTYQASLTKNYHGMPVSFILGQEKKFKWTQSKRKLEKQNLMYWGIRDLDEFEKTYIEKQNIQYVKSEQSYTRILEWIISQKLEVIHVSLDIDGIDPDYIKSTGTIAANGINISDVCQFFETLKNVCIQNGIQYNLEIVEFNPKIGKQSQLMVTKDSIRKVLQNADIKKHIL